jgi:metal-responsive CopG/Arc/MetJ family transcriptional regulator
MKTAVSIPDDVFQKAERLARRTKRSRSEVFTAALREYVARHSPDEITESLNRAFEHGQERDEFVATAARRVLEKTEW